MIEAFPAQPAQHQRGDKTAKDGQYRLPEQLLQSIRSHHLRNVASLRMLEFEAIHLMRPALMGRRALLWHLAIVANNCVLEAIALQNEVIGRY
jgi:hypothetical protein